MIIHILKTKPKSRFSLFSKLIMLIQGTNYSHYAIKFSHFVIEARVNGVKTSQYTAFIKKNVLVESYLLEIPQTLREFFNWTYDYLKRPYGFIQLFGTLFKLLGLVKTNPWGKDARKIVCCELVMLMCRDLLKIDIGDSDDYDLKQTDEFVRGLL